ncbi:ABC transporter permease [Pseudogracilibacillus sp. ICA-222130]|uniref:ABC transporter permease n=1 Tax=Pseudogracilibacillus sp. ICA-222130 TaxID=3134655 RepID=UPI0030C1B1CD
MNILAIAKREIKLGWRNSWTYSFLILFTIFITAILLLQSGVSSSEGYTDMTGTILNMTLYLLPLTTLLLGGFSATAEKEDGEWDLLSTYPMSGYVFIWGKWIGLCVILFTIILFSFGFAGLLMVLFGQKVSFYSFAFYLVFALLLAFVYVSIALLIGSIVKNRWQALVTGIAIWFLMIVIWPLLMISVLSHFPSYKFIQPTLQLFTFLNPAEFIRIFTIMRMGAGSAFGADYYEWVTWVTSSYGPMIFILVCASWIVILVYVSGFIWERGEVNGAR